MAKYEATLLEGSGATVWHVVTRKVMYASGFWVEDRAVSIDRVDAPALEVVLGWQSVQLSVYLSMVSEMAAWNILFQVRSFRMAVSQKAQRPCISSDRK